MKGRIGQTTSRPGLFDPRLLDDWRERRGWEPIALARAIWPELAEDAARTRLYDYSVRGVQPNWETIRHIAAVLDIAPSALLRFPVAYNRAELPVDYREIRGDYREMELVT